MVEPTVKPIKASDSRMTGKHSSLHGNQNGCSYYTVAEVMSRNLLYIQEVYFGIVPNMMSYHFIDHFEKCHMAHWMFFKYVIIMVGASKETYSDSKIRGANMGPTWALSAPGGPHVGPKILAIRVVHLPFDSLTILHPMTSACMIMTSFRSHTCMLVRHKTVIRLSCAVQNSLAWFL